MQEKLPPIFLRYDSYPSKTSISKSDKFSIAHAQELVLFCSLSCAFVATIKPLMSLINATGSCK